jgi:MFS transporter, DHA1 family, staphyloferrin A biosynthesis exporter
VRVRVRPRAGGEGSNLLGPGQGPAQVAQRRQLRLPNTFASLKHEHFRLLWFTSLINAGSNWLQQVTLGWLAFDLTGSALIAAVVFGVRSLPQLLIGPIGGVFGDRFDRKHFLMANTAYMSVLAMGFAMLLTFGDVKAWHLIVFTLLQGTGQAMVQPVRQALVANTVPQEDLMNAIAVNSLAQTGMRVVGPTVAGVLIALSGPALNFGLQSAAFVVTFLMLFPLRTPYSNLSRHRRTAESFSASFVGGLKYVGAQPTLLGLMLIALVPTVFTTPINLGLLPVFAKDVLHVGSDGLGVLYSSQGIGAVIGTLVIASMGNFARKGLVLAVAATGLALMITLYSQITVFLIAVPMLALGTCCFMTYQTMNHTIIQTVTPDEYRGRVMGLQMMDHGLTPLGTLIFGTVAEVYGVSTAMMVAGLCGLVAVTIILLRFPAIRLYRSDMPVEALIRDLPRGAPAEVAPARATAE